MVVGGDVLDDEFERTCKEVLEGAGGFVIEAFIGWGDTFAEKEIGTKLVGSDELGGGTATECDSMDVVGAIHEEDILRATLSRNGKTADGVGVANSAMVTREVEKAGKNREGARGARRRGGMEVSVGFIKGGVGTCTA